MAMHLATFPEELVCPEDCGKIGAYVLSKRTPTDILNEIKQNEREKDGEVKNKTAKDESPPVSTENQYLLPEETTVEPSEYTYLIPSLKPGPDGKVNWTPLGNLTGTRPAVSKYTVTRYSLDEWRNYQNKILNNDTKSESNIIDYNSKTVMMQAFGNIDKNQLENNNRLKQKAKDIFRWKSEVEQVCRKLTEEVELLEHERQRIKAASRVLMLPESISKECLELRSNRAEPDLVADLAEQELKKEMNLVTEVRSNLEATLKKIEEQMTKNKAAKHRIEYDWCDKYVAYNTETLNLSLTPKSSTIMFRPGAARFAENSAPIEYWEYFCRQNIENCEAVRQQSADLRGGLNALLVNNGKTLRSQADRTDAVLAETVAITTELCTTLEENLRSTLQKIVDMEILIQHLHDAVRKTDAAMKLAQTRLDNRNHGRPHGESVRDNPHVGLIEEVKKIHESVTSLLCQLQNAERVRKDLMNKRIELEKDIASKRKTLSIDRDRCGMIRSHYPNASQLAGISFK